MILQKRKYLIVKRNLKTYYSSFVPIWPHNLFILLKPTCQELIQLPGTQSNIDGWILTNNALEYQNQISNGGKN